MRREIAIAIIGGSVFVVILVVFLLRNGKDDGIIYKNCDSFSSQQEAQDYFIENNATHLDRDGDKNACEHLP